MPSSATITAFYTFSPSTKAKASEVNNNFSIFRGHIIPVEPNTTTSSNLVYDLGSSEHRWNNGYINNIYLTATTTGYSINNETTTSDFITIKKNNLSVWGLKDSAGLTSTANIGDYGYKEVIASTTAGASSTLTGSTITCNFNKRPTLLVLAGGADISTTSTASNIAILIDIMRGSNILSQFYINSRIPTGSAITQIVPLSTSYIDVNYTTTSIYYLRYTLYAGTQSVSLYPKLFCIPL